LLGSDATRFSSEQFSAVKLSYFIIYPRKMRGMNNVKQVVHNQDGKSILWHVDPLLDNDCEISNYTTAVAT
jgi:hypothetical protein